MSSHHDDHSHSSEPKEVSFRTPQIMGFVTILLMLVAVSTCDKKSHASTEHEHSVHGAKTEHKNNTHNVHDTIAASETHGNTPE